CILDPRFNLRGVESTLSDIEECFGTSAFSIRCHGDQSRLMDAKLKSLFAEYSNILHDKKVTTVSNGPPTSAGTSETSSGPMHSSSSAEVSSTSSGSTFWAARNRQKRDPLATSSSELKRYYAEPEPALADIENFDVLDWWKSNEKRHPVLSCVARDVLAVQASTVASQSAFSLRKLQYHKGRPRTCPPGPKLLNRLGQAMGSLLTGVALPARPNCFDGQEVSRPVLSRPI
ncbi:hypothetical protein MKW92_029303, partial [Papaver armeniacum]